MHHVYKRILLLFIILFGIIFETQVFAEGSKDFYPTGAGGKRAYLVSSTRGLTTNSWPFQSRRTIKVFVKKNEYIYVGSSVQGVIAGSINIFAPNVTPDANRTSFTFSSGSGTTVGRIANRAQKLAGPSTYKSFNYSAGPRIKNPTESDDINIEHKIFFTKPANELPAGAAYQGTAISSRNSLSFGSIVQLSMNIQQNMQIVYKNA